MWGRKPRVEALMEQLVQEEEARCVQPQKSQGRAQRAPDPASRNRKTRDLPENSCSGQGEARPGGEER